MEELIYVDRRNSNCNKWDGQTAMFGEEGLHAMWVADMDFKIPQCVQKALHEYVDFGAIGYYRIPDGYYDAFINWEKKHFNFEVKREWLRFAPGVVAAFNWMIQMLTKKGDTVIVMTPVYYPFLQAVTNNERKLITSDLVNENGNYTIDFDDFEKKIVDNDVKAFILCSPHNPVGRVWRKEELALMLVLGMTFSLAACGSSNDKKSDDTKTETTDKDSKEKMTTVKWNYGSSGNVLVTIAEEEGYFEDEGIEIEPVEATQNMDAMALLAAGKVDVVSNAGTSNPLQQIAQGVDLTIFGGHMVEGCMPVVAKAGTEWKGIE